MATMGAVVAGHATDLWGVVLVTVGVLAAVAFYGGPTPSGPAGHGARVAVGDLLGWGRFLVPLVAVAMGLLLLVGYRVGDDETRTTPEPARAVIGATLVLLAVAGLAALAGAPPAWGRRPTCSRRPGVDRGAGRQPAPLGPRGVRGRRRAGGPGRGGHGPVHRGVGPGGHRRHRRRGPVVGGVARERTATDGGRGESRRS